MHLHSSGMRGRGSTDDAFPLVQFVHKANAIPCAAKVENTSRRLDPGLARTVPRRRVPRHLVLLPSLNVCVTLVTLVRMATVRNVLLGLSSQPSEVELA